MLWRSIGSDASRTSRVCTIKRRLFLVLVLVLSPYDLRIGKVMAHLESASAWNGLQEEGEGKHYFWHGLTNPTGDEGRDSDEHSDKDGDGKLSKMFSKLTTKIKAPIRAVKAISHAHQEDPALSPHMNEVATLRRNNSLSDAELQFLDARTKRIAESGDLTKFLGLPKGTVIDPRDVPIIGLGGSGGGMRASLGFISTFVGFQECGLWPCLSYVAGVSGSCWSIASMYTLPLFPPLTAPLSARPLIQHFQDITGVHPLSSKGVNKVAEAEGGIHALFGPIKAKHKAGQEVCIIDLYSTLTSSYFWLLGTHRGKGYIDPASLKWSLAYQNGKLADGMEPWPMMTAVRHERPWHDWKSPDDPFEDMDTANSAEHEDKNAWWQWFEINPVEVGSDELEGWVPTWSFGRRFEKGVSTQTLPEYSLAFLMGLATAAPAAPLSSFLGTLWRNFPENSLGAFFRKQVKSLSKHIGDHTMDRLDNANPVHAGNQANPFFGAERIPNRGNSFENSPRLHLVDSGMANNVPTHVFVHPARDCDVVILFDASSDVQKGAALDRINDYGATKGLVFTPRVKLDPLPPLPEDSEGKPRPLSAEETRSRFDGRYAQILDGKAIHVVPGKEGIVFNDKHQPQAWRDVLLVYVPLLPNAVNPEYDPSSAPFSSSYNLVWTPEQVQSIEKTATQNIFDGLETIQMAVGEAYERRKAAREQGEINRVHQARENIARGNIQEKVFVKSAEEPDPDDGTRPWME